LLQRPGEFVRARLYLVEQPHIFDRDHCLVRESGKELDLLFGERPYRGTNKRKNAYGRSFP